MTDENEVPPPKRSRRRHGTYPKRFEMRVGDAEREVLSIIADKIEEDTGRRPGLSEVVRGLIRDRGRPIVQTIAEGAHQGGAAHQSWESRAAASKELAEQLRLLRTQHRRIDNNAGQFNAQIRQAHLDAHAGKEPALDAAAATAEALREDLARIDQRLVEIAAEVTGHQEAEQE